MNKAALSAIQPGQSFDLSGFVGDLSATKHVYVNVFVHGTYALEATLFNVFKAMHDAEATASNQELFVRQFWRKRVKSLYDSALMFDEGWWIVNPQNLATDNALSGLALRPIIEGFSQLQQQLSPKDKQLYYLFGWDGLLSQTSRRKAAVGLFNGLAEQQRLVLEFLRQQGSQAEVKVRIYCHSHGGNVALNLAWVDAFTQNQIADLMEVYTTFGTVDQAHLQLSKFAHLMLSLPEKPPLNPNYAMDKWLFKPVKNDSLRPVCDDLVLMATPIQNETAPSAMASCFGKVINLYSENDLLQVVDVVSTKARRSARYIEQSAIETALTRWPNRKIQQVCVDFQPHQVSKLSGFLRKKQHGPLHRDFWLISWLNGCENVSTRPMPLITLMPLFLAFLADIDSSWLKMWLPISLNTNVLEFKFIDMLTNLELTASPLTFSRELFQELKTIFLKRKTELQGLSLLGDHDRFAKRIHFLTRSVINFVIG